MFFLRISNRNNLKFGFKSPYTYVSVQEDEREKASIYLIAIRRTLY